MTDGLVCQVVIAASSLDSLGEVYVASLLDGLGDGAANTPISRKKVLHDDPIGSAQFGGDSDGGVFGFRCTGSDVGAGIGGASVV